MNVSGIRRELEIAKSTGAVVCLVGPPGVGKSSVVREYADSVGADFAIWHVCTWDITNPKGLPAADLANGRGVWLPYGDMLQAIEAKRHTVICVDDLGLTIPALQGPLMQILGPARQIGEHKVSEFVQFVCTTNDLGDKSGVSVPFAALKDRMRLINFRVSLDAVTDWFVSHGADDRITGFLNFRPEFVHSISPVNGWRQDGATPRSWYELSKRLQASEPDAGDEIEVCSADIGEAIAAEFVGFMRVYRELPDFDDIFTHPDKVPVSADLSTRFAVAAALAGRATVDNIGAYETYLKRIKDSSGRSQREFRLLFWRMAVTRDKSLRTTKEYVKAASDFKDISMS